MIDDDIFVVDEDEDFNPNDEFTSGKNKIQGQLHQVLQFLPDDVKHLRTTELISGMVHGYFLLISLIQSLL